MRPYYSKCRVRTQAEGNPVPCADHFFRSPVIATAFSCDGEFIASSSESSYIDIVRLPSLPFWLDVMTAASNEHSDRIRDRTAQY